jgi:hypothetical protein
VEIEFQGQKISLVKLRNPWGKGEWKSDWNDNDSRWNDVSEHEKKRIGFSKGNDGLFFMEFRHFQRYFDACQICHYRDNSKHLGLHVNAATSVGKYF